MAWKHDAPVLATRAGNALTRSTFSLALKQLLASAGLNDAAQFSAFALAPLRRQAGKASLNGSFRLPVAGTVIVLKYMSARSLTNSGN